MRRVEKVEYETFEWDERKRLHVLNVREIDFAQVAEALLKPHLMQLSYKQDEVRILAVCMIESKFVRTVYTVRNGACRIITAMAARRNEREKYRQVFSG